VSALEAVRFKEAPDICLNKCLILYLQQSYAPPIETYVGPQLSFSGTHHYKYSGNESETLEQRNNTGNDRNFVARSPSIAPVLWSILLVSCGFWLCLLGGQYFDSGRRRLVGVALFGIGLLLGAAGISPWGFWM
jgi:hypothetical protein